MKLELQVQKDRSRRGEEIGHGLKVCPDPTGVSSVCVLAGHQHC